MGKFDWIKDNPKTVCFIAGAAAAILGGKVLKSEKTRELCVSGLAKGMKLKRDAEESLKNMKEDAEDLCYEAQKRSEDDETTGADAE